MRQVSEAVMQWLVMLTVFGGCLAVLLLVATLGVERGGPIGWAVAMCAPAAALVTAGAVSWALEVLGVWEQVER